MSFTTLRAKLSGILRKSPTHVACRNNKRLYNGTIIRQFRAYSTVKKDKNYDVLIIGGGMVGGAFACALGSLPECKNLKIGLVEGSETGSILDPSKLPEIPELRVAMINKVAIDFFKMIGVWDGPLKERSGPVTGMKVWDAFSRSRGIAFDPQAIGGKLGYMVENNILTSSLYEKISTIPNVELISPATVQQIEFDQNDQGQAEARSDWVKVKTKEGANLTTRLLVGADGINSIVRRQANFPTYGFSYDQKGVVCVVEHDQPNTIAWQRFLPDGPLALLPLYGNYSSIVWSTHNQGAEQLLKLSDEDFASALEIALTEYMADQGDSDWILSEGSVASGVRKMINDVLTINEDFSAQVPKIKRVVGRKGAFPLRLAHATQYTRSRVALIGDACHVVHPLAGQGVNLGFMDAIELANTIADAVRTGRDVGDSYHLSLFENARKGPNLSVQNVINFVKQQFSKPDSVGIHLYSLHDKIGMLRDMFPLLASGTPFVSLANFQRDIHDGSNSPPHTSTHN